MATIQYTLKDVERFWSYVDKSNGEDACWIWTGCKNNSYGRFSIRKTIVLSHRFVWLITHGDIPHNIKVLHDCPEGDNPSCVNPKHLWLGTQRDNMHDMAGKGRKVNAVGEKQGSAKLTGEQVLYIREKHKEGVRMKDIAKELGVVQSLISMIVNRKIWKHI